jgi:hypothetical protein
MGLGLNLTGAGRDVRRHNAVVVEAAAGSVSSVAHIGLSVLILIGALKMKNLENMGLAKTAAIIAMIPCISPCCFLGLPIGWWALSTLGDQNVVASFYARTGPDRRYD